jgi:hypothetical protein
MTARRHPLHQKSPAHVPRPPSEELKSHENIGGRGGVHHLLRVPAVMTVESIGPDPDKPRAAVGDFGCFHARPPGCDALGDLHRRPAG